MGTALLQQDNKCFRCKKQLPKTGQVFYWLNKEHNEVYCEKCGEEIEKERFK